jgi:hypothetical protein
VNRRNEENKALNMKYQKQLAVLGIGLSLALGIATNCFAEDAPQAVTPTSRVELFNGKDFSGWKFVSKTNSDPMQTWSITNGLIHCTGKPTGYMRTVGNYRDYKVTTEWRFIKAGNTGVMVHMQEPDKVWPATIECQGAHDQQGDFWMQGGATCKDHTTKETRRVKMTEPSNEKPVGEWNTFTVECKGDAVKIIVNDKLMGEVTECSVTSGHIGLQSEGADMEVRKVTLEPLP